MGRYPYIQNGKKSEDTVKFYSQEKERVLT